MRHFIAFILYLIAVVNYAQVREIALTIDDLPLVASKMNTPGNQQRASERFMNIVQALVDNHVPATGFVIAGAIETGQWAFLTQFKDQGLALGNHTYTHLNLNHTDVDRYIADIKRADAILAPLLSTPKYFRYPYLAEGRTPKIKQQVRDYLASHNYIVAPVTIDSQDFRFNEQLYNIPFRAREDHLNSIKKRYLAFIWQQTLKAERQAADKQIKQILLLHANVLNSYVLTDVINLYKKNGYVFISLDEALKKPKSEMSVIDTTDADSNIFLFDMLLNKPSINATISKTN